MHPTEETTGEGTNKILPPYVPWRHLQREQTHTHPTSHREDSRRRNTPTLCLTKETSREGLNTPTLRPIMERQPKREQTKHSHHTSHQGDSRRHSHPIYVPPWRQLEREHTLDLHPSLSAHSGLDVPLGLPCSGRPFFRYAIRYFLSCYMCICKVFSFQNQHAKGIPAGVNCVMTYIMYTFTATNQILPLLTSNIECYKFSASSEVVKDIAF